MKKQTVLITGASKGIGSALATIFLQNGYHVIGTGRTGSTDKLSHEDFEMLPLDLSSPADIKRFEKEFAAKQSPIDILINNAGVGPDLNHNLPDEETFASTFEVNITGTVFFTECMLTHIHTNGKIINISSKMGSLSQCISYDSVAYRCSKAALNMYGKILGNRLQGRYKLATIHPGWVRTGIAGPDMNGRLSPEESALGIFRFVTGDFTHGIFWNVESGSECEW